MDQERRPALLTVKLGALVREGFGVTNGAPMSFPGGAALLADGRAWILLDEGMTAAVGPALAWAQQQHVDELHLLTEGPAGFLARRAGAFVNPPTVWWVHGTSLHHAAPEPLPPPVEAIDAPHLVALLRAAGLDVVPEHGFIAGELRGLEVARIIMSADDELHLEVGVGQADRELTAMLHGDLTPEAALERVVHIVDEHRRGEAPAHPLNRLVPERWLRSVLEAQPELIGMASLRAAALPTPRGGLKERGIAPAVGSNADGSPVVVVCSVGIDLDLVPAAADARAALAPDAPLVLAVPERDVHPVTDALAQRLRAPASIVGVPDGWRTVAPA